MSSFAVLAMYSNGSLSMDCVLHATLAEDKLTVYGIIIIQQLKEDSSLRSKCFCLVWEQRKNEERDVWF